MDDLITLYQQRFCLKNATFSRIEHDDATVAVVYKIITSAGTPLILKICARDNHYAHELYCLRLFAGRLPVPTIIAAIPPGEHIQGAILMEFIPGVLLTAKDFTDALAYDIGALLARIHLNRMPGYGDLAHVDNPNPDPRSYITKKFVEGLAECDNHLPPALIEECRDYFDSHIDLLTAADGPCITHRDFRPGNIIVHNGKVQGIIDWSSARASFAQEDFCPLEHGSWPTNETNKKSFLAGYASIRPVPDYSQMMPLLRLYKAVTSVGFTVKRGTWDNRDARLYNHNRRFLDTFFQQPSA